MIRRNARSRAGITLTEILISILIMGVGLLSLATLFPLGLLRLREAARSSRSSMLTESAISEVSARNLLGKWQPGIFYPWYGFDPFVRDTPLGTAVVHTAGAGLPVAYDPLWWYQLMLSTSFGTNPSNTEVRFGDGSGGYVRGAASAFGLQRITNFGLTLDTAGKLAFDLYGDPSQVVGSPDDIVFLAEGRLKSAPSSGTASATDTGSPILPDFSPAINLNPLAPRPVPSLDLSYTWMLTVRQSDVTNDTIFDGDVVTSHNRPFAAEQVTLPNGGTALRAAGETTVEGVWGYGSGVPDDASLPLNQRVIYGGSDTTVLLRWPASQPDPDVRVGGWIADVTYERSATSDLNLYGFGSGLAPRYPGQRCHWYRVARRTEATADPKVAGFRRMIVTTATPLRAKTRLNSTNADDQAVIEAALIAPHVVNVYPKVFYAK